MIGVDGVALFDVRIRFPRGLGGFVVEFCVCIVVTVQVFLNLTLAVTAACEYNDE